VTAKEKELAGFLLEKAGDEFGNHGCNDMDPWLLKNWSDEDKVTFIREFGAWNGDPDNWKTVEDFNCLGDDCFMGFLAHKLKMEAITA